MSGSSQRQRTPLLALCFWLPLVSVHAHLTRRSWPCVSCFPPLLPGRETAVRGARGPPVSVLGPVKGGGSFQQGGGGEAGSGRRCGWRPPAPQASGGGEGLGLPPPPPHGPCPPGGWSGGPPGSAARPLGDCLAWAGRAAPWDRMWARSWWRLHELAVQVAVR